MEKAEPEKSSTEILDDLFSLVQNKDVKYKECLVIEETGDLIGSEERKDTNGKKKKNKEKKKRREKKKLKEKKKKRKKARNEEIGESDNDCVIIRDTRDETKTFSSKKKKKHKKHKNLRKGDIEVIKERNESIKEEAFNVTADVNMEKVEVEDEKQEKTENCMENNIITHSKSGIYDANLSLPDELTQIKDEKNNIVNINEGETEKSCRSKTRSRSRDKKHKGRSKGRKSKSRKSHGKKDKKKSRTRERSISDRSDRSRSNPRSSDRGRRRSDSRDLIGRSERSSSRRSRSRELIAAAEKFEKVKKSKMAMKQHLMEKKKLFKIAKSNVQGVQKQSLDALTNMCWVIAKQGKNDEDELTETQEAKPEVVTEVPKVATKAPLNTEEVTLYAFCTPSASKLKQSNENYIRILNIELEKCSKSMGKVETFWMSDNGYDRAWEKMSDNKKLRPFAVGTLASAEYEDDQKRFLPTTIKIQTKNPSKWLKDTGFRKTIFARASLFGDINIQDNEASGRNLPSSSFPTSAGRQPVKPKPTITSEGGDQSGWLTRRSQYDGSIEHVLVCR